MTLTPADGIAQTSFSEVPDTVVNNRYAHYVMGDVSASDGGSVTTVPDREGNYDFTVPSGQDAPTYRASGPSGEPYVEFSTDTEQLEATLGATLSPYTLVAVWRSESAAPSGERGMQFIYSSGGFNGNRGNERASDGQILYAGSNQFIEGAAGNSSWHIEGYIQNGSSSSIRRDGTQTSTGNPGTRGLGQTVTLDLDVGGDGDLAEWIFFDGDYSGTQTLTDAETYLSNKYGITI